MSIMRKHNLKIKIDNGKYIASLEAENKLLKDLLVNYQQKLKELELEIQELRTSE